MSEPIDISPIKARAEKATKGPWRAVAVQNVEDATECAEVLLDDAEESEEPEGPTIFTTEDYDIADLRRPGVTTSPLGDAEFVAHARTDVPLLLSEVERLREENRKLRRALHDLLMTRDTSWEGDHAGEWRAAVEAAEEIDARG